MGSDAYLGRNNKSEKAEQSAWKISYGFIAHLTNCMVRSSSNFMRGNYYQSFLSSQEIRVAINPDLEQKEKDFLNGLSLEIKKLSIGHNKMVSMILNDNRKNIKENELESRKLLKKQSVIFQDKVMEYRLFIMSLLGKYGYNVPKEQDDSYFGGRN